MNNLPNKCEKLKTGIYVNLNTMKMFDVTNFERSRAILVCSNSNTELIPYSDFQDVLEMAENMRYLGTL